MAKKYEESEAVKRAKDNLDAQIAQKPGAYQSQWQAQLNDTLQKIQNREKFNYNINADALYQSYKDKFVRQGQQAMQDTMGQAAALTGGYGSSYGQNAGQQAYNAYLQNLGDVVPELYDIARSRYDQEGADLLNMYGILGDNEARDYGRWQDTMDAWQGERDYLAGLYDSERAFDYGKYRDDVADDQWAQQLAAAQAARYSGGGSPVVEEPPAKSTAPTITANKKEESAKGTGVTSYSNVMKTVNAYLSMGQETKALAMIDSIYPQLSSAQKKDVDALLKKLGYVYE
jgi:hypothetical protein